MKAFLEEVQENLPGKDEEYQLAVADALLKKNRAIIKCLHCGDVIISLYRWDMRWCSCQSVAIDGGKDYCKVNSAMNARFIEISDIRELQATLVGPRDIRDDIEPEEMPGWQPSS